MMMEDDVRASEYTRMAGREEEARGFHLRAPHISLIGARCSAIQYKYR